MAENSRRGALQLIISSILITFEPLHGYKMKEYVVSEYHLKLQLKKLSRTRDI